MCFVLDANAFHCLFDKDSKEHAEYAPLRDWLYKNRRTSLVVGGTKYRTELGRLRKYLGFIAELQRNRKLSEIIDTRVDLEEERISAMVTDPDFDDAHIVALLCASGCRIFASNDKRADSFVKDRQFYARGQNRPRIYRSNQHKSLLTDANIVALKNLHP